MHLTEPKSAPPYVPLTRDELDMLDARARAGEEVPDFIWGSKRVRMIDAIIARKEAKQP